MGIIEKLWCVYRRWIDRMILWPSCKRVAIENHPSDYLEYAKGAFAVHVRHDPAWQILGEDEIARRINDLK